MVIRDKGKFGYLDGTITRLDTTDATYQNWEVQNSIFMAWLIHSMEESIGDTYLFYSTAKEIWDVVSLAYSDFKDFSQIFELRNHA